MRPSSFRSALAAALAAAALACSQPRSGEAGADTLPAPVADGGAGQNSTSPPPTPANGSDAGVGTSDVAARDAPAPPAPDAPAPRPPDAPPARDVPTGQGQLGEVCSAADDCQSGFCQHGVCCASRCPGPCRHCNLPGRAGTCIDSAGPSPAIGCAVDGEICLAPNQCLGPDQSCVQFLPRDATDGEAIAQTFVAGRSGRLVAVRLAVICYGKQEVTLEIHTANNVDPEGPLLSAQTVRGPAPPQDTYGEGRVIALPAPIPVRSGDQLSIVVRFSGPPYCSVGLGNGGCNFPGRFYRRTGTPPAWVIDNNTDAGFRTYVVE